jgi:hypothetical protein
LYGTLAFFGIGLWFLWGQLILGNALYFTQSQFSAAAKSLVSYILQTNDVVVGGYTFTDMAKIAENKNLISSSDHEILKKIRRHGAMALRDFTRRILTRSKELAKREAQFSESNLKILRAKYLK